MLLIPKDLSYSCGSSVLKIKISFMKNIMIRARLIYHFADIVGQYRPIADISVSVYIFSEKYRY